MNPTPFEAASRPLAMLDGMPVGIMLEAGIRAFLPGIGVFETGDRRSLLGTGVFGRGDERF